jgi:hypothetical protein
MLCGRRSYFLEGILPLLDQGFQLIQFSFRFGGAGSNHLFCLCQALLNGFGIGPPGRLLVFQFLLHFFGSGRNASVTGYGFRQREKRSYLNIGIFGEFVEEGFKDRF